MTQILGQQGELLAAQYLENQGFCILAKNYKKFFGEIDIIAKQGNLVAFVEVKTRTNNLISLHELVTPPKQRKIIRVAQSFISALRSTENITYRFDVALIHVQPEKKELTYIPNAFCPQEY
jgi:putative endonuclease